MKNCNMILTEKRKNNSFLIRKIDKYECLTGEDILPPDQSRVIKQAKFFYSLSGKAFEKEIKTNKDQGKRTSCSFRIGGTSIKTKSIERIFQKKKKKRKRNIENNEIKNESHKINKLEE